MALDDSTVLEASLDFLRSALERQGWEVSGKVTTGGLSFDLRHPLLEYGYTIPRTKWSSIEVVLEQFVTRDEELARVRKGPQSPTHANLVRGLRNAAANYQWTAETVDQLASSLVELGALDEDEADWLHGAAQADSSAWLPGR